ncbi:hypothetical protein ELI36_37425 [Rhizobium ruizarguesonis]|uniref:Uncharacterized protein n=1 Tax=Rhizobium ruizarguesonis TaxID=2081791 RepID=A0ABY1WYJ7_9HYPH|nr:hypothetical protein [Rhizobium ruizarguesonis]TAU13161.1 hypothetical protein ELI48_37560 [Rhizobium ruizarguesonis]TAU58442.1 hypothetical protein ELI45_32930 [Rhizobium ruizarguesonis]TAV03186.1 hypothetical protein ELI34_32720 [Rhizobium ruizarguesonis]TAV19118.1 hypothetical protein ELI36_37425 [Rhizobium ruizarguesonis]TAV20023.1 hypothetical protein ELI33_38225 [Rhizobium ruizarguesonis]
MSVSTSKTIQDLFDPNMQATVQKEVPFEGSTYYMVEQTSDVEAARSLIEVTNGVPRLITAEMMPGDPALTTVPDQVLRALLPDVDFRLSPSTAAAPPGFTRPRTKEEVRALVLQVAKQKVGSDDMDSGRLSPPETNHGHLACAWAVNRIVNFALGQPVGGGLSTTAMGQVLKSKDIVIDGDEVIAGMIIISPTAGTNIGHVGIRGEGGLIYSNSSSHGQWEQNKTIDSWTSYYHEGKGLPVLHYQLDPARFPGPVTS